MEFLAKEIIAPYLDSLFSPGVLAAATVTTLVFVSGLGARAIDWFEVIGRVWDSSTTRAEPQTSSSADHQVPPR